MTRKQQNSIIDSGLNRVFIEEGRVINVNIKRWTVDVRTEGHQSLFLDAQWGNAYLHFSNGEGIFAMPEVGAKCMVCRPSESPPFVMCFVTTFERDMSTNAEDNQAERGSMEGQEEANANISFAAGRPDLQQGDIMLRCRDGNQIWLRRGGVVEIGSTAVCKRLYIPLLNYIRDLCENYSLMTFGGDLVWNVQRVDGDPDGEAKALLRIVSKEAAQDEKGSIAIRAGYISEDDRLSIIVAPDSINMETMEVTGSAKFEFKVDKEGTVEVTTKKDMSVTVEGDFDQTVQGSASFTYQGGVTYDVSGDEETTISGSHTMTASNSEERVSGNKVINSPSIQLGSGGASSPVVLFNALVTWLTTHTHPMNGSPPTTPVSPTMAARKVTAE